MLPVRFLTHARQSMSQGQSTLNLPVLQSDLISICQTFPWKQCRQNEAIFLDKTNLVTMQSSENYRSLIHSNLILILTALCQFPLQINIHWIFVYAWNVRLLLEVTVPISVTGSCLYVSFSKEKKLLVCIMEKVQKVLKNNSIQLLYQPDVQLVNILTC